MTQRTAVHVLFVDMERAASCEALRQTVSEAMYERARRTRGRYVAIWLGVRGDALIPLADVIDMVMVQRLAVDLADGRGLITLNPLELAPETLEETRRELRKVLETAAPTRRRSRLRLVVDNPAVAKRPSTTAGDEKPSE